MPPESTPKFFKTQNDLRKWFIKNYKTATTLQLGYYKVGTGKPSVTWPQSVDEALCFGWIDGVRHTIDEESYTIRFTHRKPTSIWSAINIAKVEKLLAEGLMYPEGIEAFNKRKDHLSRVYSFESEAKEFSPELDKIFKDNKKAWEYFNSIAPSYRKIAIHLVTSAKQEATRMKRFEKLIADCAAGKKFWKLNG
jgi:uncharacterized protein YdeI (YjbR/CyaY-like superfamily)